MNKILIRVAFVAAASISLVSCATSRVDANFGDAVRSNVEAQVYDPIAANSPSRDPVLGTDGQRMETVMEAHRSQAGSSDNVSQPIVINTGN